MSGLFIVLLSIIKIPRLGANNKDPDQMPYSVKFDLRLQLFANVAFMGY